MAFSVPGGRTEASIPLLEARVGLLVTKPQSAAWAHVEGDRKFIRPRRFGPIAPCFAFPSKTRFGERFMTREAVLTPVPIGDLRPTQITLGYREVALKRRQWRDHVGDDLPDFLKRHVVPTVLGPKNHYYLIDRHHLVRAMLEEKIEAVTVSVEADLSCLRPYSFWVYLDDRAWCHCYDEDGRRRDFDAIPKSVKKMKDDAYRSLAGELRRAGGFAKDVTPFSEFLWADFLRGRVPEDVVHEHFGDALVQALALAKEEDANYLPGWCGPDPVS